jgi:uncharacterized protein
VRIIIDTNLWISLIISKKLTVLDEIITKNEIKILFCDELLIEIGNTISKPKLENRINGFSLTEMFYAIQDFIEMVRISSKIDICRDVKDNFPLNLAVDGKADYLITGDKDLLILEQIENTQKLLQ